MQLAAAPAAIAAMLLLTLPVATFAVTPTAEWNAWEAHAAQCSTTCGQGIRCRRRSCVQLTGGATASRIEVNMDSCPGGEKASRDCLPCRAYVECPRNGAWSSWSEWTNCQIENRNQKAMDPLDSENKALKAVGGQAEEYVNGQAQGLAMPQRGDALELDSECGKGFRRRSRTCDKPSPDPSGLLCDNEGRQEAMPCEVPCNADLDFLSVVKSMLAKDLEENPNQLYYVNYGAAATLDCKNDAYSMALRGVLAYQDLQIQWRRNNESVTALVSRLQKFMEEHEERKGLQGSQLSGARQSKLETVQLRSFGTQLTIDPVDAEGVGLYACYMVLDGEHYIMRSFTLLTRQLPVRQFMESEMAKMPTNAETFVSPQLPILEAATVRWYHNGLPNREHMLADWHERAWDLTLAYKDTGAWECYIMLDGRQWKTNEFQLSITDEASFIQKFDDVYTTYFLATCALILYAVVGFPLAVITLRQREDNWITAEEQRCIEYVRQINYLYMARYVRKIS